MGRAAWLQALIPGCYDRASGWEIWRVSSTGLSLHLPALSWQVLFHSAASTSFQTYSVYTYICVFAGADTSLGSYLGEGKKEKKQSFSESSSHAVCVTLLDIDLWWKELLRVSSVCEPTSGNIPGGLFCIFFVCECWCTCIRSGLPGLGQRRWALLWTCSGSPAPISRSPLLCLAAGAGSQWMQKAACSSGGRKRDKRKKGTGYKHITECISCILYSMLRW